MHPILIIKIVAVTLVAAVFGPVPIVIEKVIFAIRFNNRENWKKCVWCNRYVLDEIFMKLVVMSWIEIVVHQADYQERWHENIRDDDVLLRYKTRLVIQHAAAGPIKEFDLKLMLAVMDHITVFEEGRLQIKFHDETEFEVETE